MRPAQIRRSTLRQMLAVWFAAFALATRIVVPAGFMPVSGTGFAITLCTGEGMVAAWVDEQGKVHKDSKGPADKSGHPCAFSGVGPALQAPLFAGGAEFPDLAADRPTWSWPAPVSVGHGLAAPPPPSTGPPLLA